MTFLKLPFDETRDDHHDALRLAIDELLGDDLEILIRALRDPYQAMTRERPGETDTRPDALYLLRRLARILNEKIDEANIRESDRRYLMTDARMERAADERIDGLNRSREP